jgi:rifampicin phosphotransferase
MTQDTITGRPAYLLYSKTEPLLKEVGGKGLSLIKMAGAGLPVPPGFVMTVEFFRPWLDALKAGSAWREFLAAKPEDYHQRCKALKDACAGFQLDDAQKTIIKESLDTLEAHHREGLFAVRSSSPEEDLDGASFAGGYETVLGVRAAGFPEAIRRCFVSCLDERVFFYKKEHGFATNDARIAVVVQVQVASEVSGVGFSLNPLTNCYDEAVINANWGLGESVVSGMTSPDQFVIDKVRKFIMERKTGKKEVSVWLKGDGGTEQRADPRHDQPCLSDDQILEVTATITRIEDFYGKPMDTEWAFEKGRLYMLQARPITAYVPLPDYRITPPGEPKNLYIDALLCVQGIHDPMSMMGTGALRHILGMFSRQALGVDISPAAFGEGGEDQGGKIYSNVSLALHMAKKEKLAAFFTNVDMITAEVVRSIDEDEYRAREMPQEFKGLPFKALTHMPDTFARVFETALLPGHAYRAYMKELQAYVHRMRAEEAKNLPLMEFYQSSCSLFAHFIVHSSIPVVAVPLRAKMLVRELFKDDPPEIHAQVEHLDRSLPGNVTVEMGLALFHLSTFLDPADTVELATMAEKLRSRTLPGEFLAAWDDFMEKYGFRGPAELDIASPRYRDMPLLLLQQVKSIMAIRDTDQNPEAVYERSQQERHKAYEVLSEVAHKKGWLKAKEFEKLYRVIETFGGYRETHKYYLIQMIDLLRRRILAEAEKLVAAGRIDTPMHVFNITIEDLDEALKNPSLDLRARMKRRMVYIEKLRSVKDFPHIIDSRGKILRPARKVAKEGEFAGEAISAGVVRGIVKVLHTPDEKPVNPGDILVARATDPGWTPLFINAVAIVLEVGGMLQHGSLVAREYGKPCVAGIENITNLLRDGQEVEVDGSNGVIRTL